MTQPSRSHTSTDHDRPTSSPSSSGEFLVVALVNEHRRALVDYATRLTSGDVAWAEDAVQETFVRAWRHIDRMQPELGSVRGWLMRVCHNVVMDGHRAARCRPMAEALDESSDMPAVADETDHVIDRLEVHAALALLSEPHRTALAATYLSDRTAAEAAAALGVPVGTVKSRVYYGLRALRTALAREPGHATSEDQIVPAAA